MNIDDYKNTYKQMKATSMDMPGSKGNVEQLSEFILRIRKQDKEDERYMLHNLLIPVLFGLVCFTLVCIIAPITSPVLIAGSILIYLGLGSVLIFILLDLINISKELFDQNLLEFLELKIRRLRSWRSTRIRYILSFVVFVIGLILLILGNSGLMGFLKSYAIIIPVISGYLAILVVAWIIGEHFYRKRHRKKHQPLIDEISGMINEINRKENGSE
jgi:hypothetical protein